MIRTQGHSLFPIFKNAISVKAGQIFKLSYQEYPDEIALIPQY